MQNFHINEDGASDPQPPAGRPLPDNCSHLTFLHLHVNGKQQLGTSYDTDPQTIEVRRI